MYFTFTSYAQTHKVNCSNFAQAFCIQSECIVAILKGNDQRIFGLLNTSWKWNTVYNEIKFKEHTKMFVKNMVKEIVTIKIKLQQQSVHTSMINYD